MIRIYSFASAVFALACAGLIGLTLIVQSLPAIRDQGFALFTTGWHPYQGQFGILPMLYGTLIVMMIAVTLAVPFGVMSAICLSEIISPKYRVLLKSALEILAGIPSIIYGLIGVAFFTVWIGDVFALQSGRTILAAGILLAIMILPLIITLCDDALQNVPDRYRETAAGLGLYKYEIVKNVLLPVASADIAGAILLSVGRALGETMAVMLVIGSLDHIPVPAYNILAPAQTVTSKLGREIAEASFGSVHFSALIFMSLLLVAFCVTLASVAQLLLRPSDRLAE